MKSIFEAVIVIFLFFTLNSGLGAQGMGMSFTPSSGSFPEKYQREKDLFIENIALRFSLDPGTLYKYWERGYGRFETVSLILIASKSQIPFTEIIKARAKGTSLRKLAERNKIDYGDIRKETELIVADLQSKTTVQLETKFRGSQPLVDISTKTIKN